jgi:hypothetical protein
MKNYKFDDDLEDLKLNNQDRERNKNTLLYTLNQEVTPWGFDKTPDTGLLTTDMVKRRKRLVLKPEDWIKVHQDTLWATECESDLHDTIDTFKKHVPREYCHVETKQGSFYVRKNKIQEWREDPLILTTGWRRNGRKFIPEDAVVDSKDTTKAPKKCQFKWPDCCCNRGKTEKRIDFRKL